MSTVRFSCVEEFARELAHDADAVERRIIRVADLSRAVPGMAGAIRDVSVAATAKVAGDVVRLEAYCGQWWGPQFPCSESTVTAVRSMRERLEQVASDLGLTVRSGLLEEGASL